MAYELPELAYPYDALEPHIDAQTMEIHHTRHHQTYINNANNLLKDNSELEKLSADELLKKLSEVPENIRSGLRNNVGGHYNHSFFWTVIAPGKGGTPTGKLGVAINASFESFEKFKEAFSKVAAARFGSGWAWLYVNSNGKLAIDSTANQDNPLMGKAIAGIEGQPIIGLDVWEHAYYLRYQNRRPDYINAFWNLVDWEAAEARYTESLA